VLVEIEEDRAGGMGCALHAEAGPRRDVLEFRDAEILEQDVPHPDGGDEQVRQTVVIDVSKRSGDADLVCEGDARRGRDVLELAASHITPELTGSELIDEVDVETAI